MPIKKNLFWDDLARDLEEPGQLRLFLLESLRISTLDSIVDQLDKARINSGLSKADLARKLGSEPANIRRFFTNRADNPTLSTLTEIAASVGMCISLEPILERKLQDF